MEHFREIHFNSFHTFVPEFKVTIYLMIQQYFEVFYSWLGFENIRTLKIHHW